MAALLLVAYLNLGIPEPVFTVRPAMAQWDGTIEDVIEGLDRDFSFGGKEEIKRENLQITNETNREEIKIRELSPQTNTTQATAAAAAAVAASATITFSIVEFGPANGVDSLLVSFAGQTLVSGLNNNTVVVSVNAVPGSSQTLTVNCLAALSIFCDYEVTIVSGATINGSSSTGFQMQGAGSAPATFTVLAS